MTDCAISMVVNGKAVEARVRPRTLLVQFLREGLGLTGTHVGCDTSQCGACTVHLDGRAIKSCTILAAQASGRDIMTIEGLDPAGRHPLQDAFQQCHGLQCGYCTPGMIMAAADLLARNDAPSDSEIRDALDGNLCRCTGYQQIIEAVLLAAESKP